MKYLFSVDDVHDHTTLQHSRQTLFDGLRVDIAIATTIQTGAIGMCGEFSSHYANLWIWKR